MNVVLFSFGVQSLHQFMPCYPGIQILNTFFTVVIIKVVKTVDDYHIPPNKPPRAKPKFPELNFKSLLPTARIETIHILNPVFHPQNGPAIPFYFMGYAKNVNQVERERESNYLYGPDPAKQMILI